jgi:hypothetical protein
MYTERVGTGVAASIALFFVATSAHAVTRAVPGEYSSSQSAVDASSFGDTVLVAPGTYSDVESRDLGTANLWTACLFLADNVTVKSEAGPASTIIDMKGFIGSQPSVVIARFLSSSETVLEGFTITGAPFGARGIYTFQSSITVKGCVVRDIDCGLTNGAGMIAQGTHSIIDTEFVNCRSSSGGGAIYHSNGHLNLIGCTIRDCDNPGVELEGIESGPTASAVVANCTFMENASTGLRIDDYYGGVTITECVFVDNVQTNAGAGGLKLGGGDFVVTDCLFIRNGAMASNGQGGGLSLGSAGGGTCYVARNTFYGNYKVGTSVAGAAVAFFRDATFENNIVAASTGGAAVFNSIFADLTAACNVYWENVEGVGVPLEETDRIVDPLFCDPGGDNYTLQGDSPCLPAFSLGCGLIGAHGAGCNATASSAQLRAESWGRIKSSYR